MIEEPHITDHKLVTAYINIPRPIHPKKVISYRDFKNADYGEIGEAICKIRCNDSSDLLHMIDDFVESLIAVFNTHVPLLTKSITIYPTNLCPSERTLEAKTERDKLYKMMQKN